MTKDARWTLWRQDDNGSAAIIDQNLSKEVAESTLQELEARGHKQHYWIEQSPAPSAPCLNLVVIRAENIDTSRAFYELLGLELVLHRHGKEQEHYACESTGLTFEIYPETETSSVGARIGFSVPNVDFCIEKLTAAGHTILNSPKDSEWGRRAVARDPDGHSVELTSPVTP